jgi:hypothetical protein
MFRITLIDIIIFSIVNLKKNGNYSNLKDEVLKDYLLSIFYSI